MKNPVQESQALQNLRNALEEYDDEIAALERRIYEIELKRQAVIRDIRDLGGKLEWDE